MKYLQLTLALYLYICFDDFIVFFWGDLDEETKSQYCEIKGFNYEALK